ncbi:MULTISPECIES: glycosyltransferase family 2 protein [Microbulbifer]|uniref:glycosyltransferase family 2 protein n=1 Tax=Microbulbifer TaxID=48073 RepID=UPI001E2C047B|nr:MULTISPECIES: glycosyltransferase family 2 protein [Microbulbifer]UHQ54913.1 glycosyltransferase family 2 protein [Microbulbifer sp. YPW16]
MTDVAVIIVNYNTGHLVAENIERIFSSVIDTRLGLRLFIVDNASTDDSLSILSRARAASPHAGSINLIESKQNGGFSYGNNLALQSVSRSGLNPDYYYFLNPDAYPEKGAIDALVAFSRNQGDLCILGSTLLDENRVPRPSAFRFPSLVSELQRAVSLALIDRLFPHRRVSMGVPEQPIEADWVTGAGFFLSEQVLSRLGHLDSGYFLYFEEVDYMRRARRMDITIYSLPDSRIVHLAGAATKIVGSQSATRPMPDYWYESWNRYFYKNHSRGYALAAGLAWLSGRVANHLLAIFVPRRRPADGHSMGRFLKKAVLGN